MVIDYSSPKQKQQLEEGAVCILILILNPMLILTTGRFPDQWLVTAFGSWITVNYMDRWQRRHLHTIEEFD